MLTIRFLRPCVAAAVIAAGIGSYAQTGSSQTDALLAERRAEEQRHSAVSMKIQNERIDAQKQLNIDLNNCTASTGPSAQKCALDAQDNFKKTTRNINNEQFTEDATHTKNMNAINHKSDVACTRPDCVNSSNSQKPNCQANCSH